MYVKGYPVIEGLLNAVHLDHLIELEVNEEDLLKHTGETITLKSWAEDYFESASGRVVTIHVTHTAADGTLLARETERFAIRGRVYSDALPADAPEFGDAEHEEIAPTPRRLLRRVKVVAPHDMTAFARTSGDFNPIHTSTRGARISGLAAPLVHGWWLSRPPPSTPCRRWTRRMPTTRLPAGPTTCTAWFSLTTPSKSPSSASARCATAA